MYFRKTYFLPCWSFVSFGIWRNVRGYVRDWNKSSWKGRTGKKKVAEYIRTPVTCIELCVTSWQSQAVSGSQNVRERVIGSREYIWLIQTHFYFARDNIKSADVVGSINHVTFLINRFSRLISLLTPTIFVSGTSELVSYFLEFSCITTILKNIGV